jgi:hypothetical protein
MTVHIYSDDKTGCTCRHPTGACCNKRILENPIPAPIYCPFESQESQQRFCGGYTGTWYHFDIVYGRMVPSGELP